MLCNLEEYKGDYNFQPGMLFSTKNDKGEREDYVYLKSKSEYILEAVSVVTGEQKEISVFITMSYAYDEKAACAQDRTVDMNNVRKMIEMIPNSQVREGMLEYFDQNYQTKPLDNKKMNRKSR